MVINQFRRFTYFITTKNQDVSKVIRLLKSDKIQQDLQKSGILALETYQEELHYFILIDAKPQMNSIAIEDVIKNVVNNFSFESSPLERIYKLDQREIYSSEEGQLKKSVNPYKRFVWTLLLQEDTELMAEYKRVHSIGQAWPEITANMKSVGVKDMEIYLHGTQAILIMDTKADFNLEEVAPKWQQLPRESEWQEYVAKFQRTDPESSIQEKWKNMFPI